MMTGYRVGVGWVLAASVAGLAIGHILAPGHAAADRSESAATVKRVGMVIGIKPDQIAAYRSLHADNKPGVRDLLTKANMRNFSIFMRRLNDGQTYLFGYYEYVGDDFDADMAWLAAQPRNKQWLKVTDAMQVPLQGERSWAAMQVVYHNQ